MASPGTSFASVAKRDRSSRARIVPNDDQGIIIETIDNIPTEDYLIALTNITEHQNIIYSGKMSKNRLCVYFKHKIIAETITKNHKTIQVQNENINIRPLITPSRRLIISNARPSVPDDIIINTLKQFGLQPTSELYFLRAGLKRPELSHILSFRRCLYIQNIENQDIPETTVIEHGGVTHRIFISEDLEQCTICKRHGHSSEICRFKNNQITPEPPAVNPTRPPISQPIQQIPQLTTNQQISQQHNPENNEEQNEHTKNNTEQAAGSQTEKAPSERTSTNNNNDQIIVKQKELTAANQATPIQDINSASNSHTDTQKETETGRQGKSKKNPTSNQNNNTTNPSQQTNKRTAVSLSSVDSTETIYDETAPDDNKNNTQTKIRKPNKLKRPRSLSPGTPTEEWLKPAKKLFDSFILTYEEFYSLIESLSNSSRPLDTIKEYTDDVIEIQNMLKELYQTTKNRSARVRLTKMINNIQAQLDETSSEEDNEEY